MERPAPHERSFRSHAIDKVIQEFSDNGSLCPRLMRTFANCLPYTLDYTVQHFANHDRSHPDSFIITGDIPAMWLRDSTRQVMPYLQFVNQDDQLKALIEGVIRRQVHQILLDPYANAFYVETDESAPPSPWSEDVTDMKPGVHERKWECDSLCAFIELATRFVAATGDHSIMEDPDFMRAVISVLQVFEVQQRWNGPGPYQFRRRTDWGPDAVMENGFGQIWRPCGAIYSVFRPSDDSTMFGFNTAQNLYAAEVLQLLSAMIANLPPSILPNDGESNEVISRSRRLREQIITAIMTNAIADHGKFGKIFCYEFDGFGNKLLMDDANVPSLLSIPLMSKAVLEELPELKGVYSNTRRFVLSECNPFFFRSAHCCGVGSPHTMALPKRIWPLSILIRGLTATTTAEMMECIRMVIEHDGGCYVMHESFDADDPRRFTRAGFAWANATFASLILHAHKTAPQELARLAID